MLVAHGALPPRDEPLARLERAVADLLAQVPAGEVIGRWARSAHYCADHIQAGGLLFPTRRWVLLIGPGNRWLPFPTTVSLQLTDVRPSSAAGLLALGVRNAFLAVESSRRERRVALVARSTQCRCLLASGMPFGGGVE